LMQTISAGGSQIAYSQEGGNKYPIRQYLRPFQQTANLCKMTYLPPFVVYDSNRADAEKIKNIIIHYQKVINWLTGQNFKDISVEYELMTDYITEKTQGTDE
ncbi:MAG TPA: NAD(P)H-dependent oxidoreductase, partial [Saprospiraceae bacterium]|nr:NAD(P)H-dependent oxidoreductase [Saprospiraceae bacterium]